MSRDKNELKIRALLERISSLTTNYENQVAELRVELTLVAEQLEEALKELQAWREKDAEISESESPEPSE